MALKDPIARAEYNRQWRLNRSPEKVMHDKARKQLLARMRNIADPEKMKIRSSRQYAAFLAEATEEQKEQRRATARDGMKFHRDRKKEVTYRYKGLVGCRDCGEKDPIVLEFHHEDPTTKHPSLKRSGNKREASYGLMRLPLKDMLDEMEKCAVLCANCHRREEARLREEGVA